MRIAPVVALLASAALHAGVLLYAPPNTDSRNAAALEAVNPGVVIIAHLKNTLDDEPQTRERSR